MRNVTRSLLALTLAAASVCTAASYKPEWASLDRRPTPSWWTEAKFGIFIHWGPYAVPAYAPVLPNGRFSWDGYAEWYQGKMRAKKKPFLAHHQTYYGGAPYANFAAAFTARFYKPDEWADLFKRAGAKYVVLTSKHHDGYALWPSAQTPYFNSVALGSGRDLAGEFCRAMRAAGLKRGFYFSMLEYANALYPGGRDSTRSPGSYSIGDWNRFVNIPQLKDLVNRYEADIIWPDGEWDYTSAEHGSEQFLAWLFNESKVKETVVINDRWGKETRGRHGGHYTTEYGHASGAAKGAVIQHPWEECRGIGGSFGYNRFETTEHYMSRRACIELLVRICSRGGNLLLNVGPDAEGRIPAIMEDRLLAMGRWLAVNGEAIYATTRAPVASPAKGVYLTAKGNVLYVIDFNLTGTPLTLDIARRRVASVKLLGSDAAVAAAVDNGRLRITPPALTPGRVPCEHAWTYAVSFAADGR
jgi:alpha-L-fucosidase